MYAAVFIFFVVVFLVVVFDEKDHPVLKTSVSLALNLLRH